MPIENKDKPGKSYWDSNWSNSTLPVVLDPSVGGFRNYPNYCFHQLFCKLLSGLKKKKVKLLEIGCANSLWLPYFKKEFNFDVWGIDYSEIGCDRTRELLSQVGVEAKVVCADIFNPPESLLGNFDVVISFGVLEHFEGTKEVVQVFSDFLSPDGILITVIPNMIGLNGKLQKILNQDVYNIHVPLSLNDLVASHKVSSLVTLKKKYFMSSNLSVLNLNGLADSKITSLKYLLLLYLTRLNKLIWIFEENFFTFPESSYFSPYIVIACRKSNKKEGILN